MENKLNIGNISDIFPSSLFYFFQFSVSATFKAMLFLFYCLDMQVQICVIIFLLSCVHNGVGIPIDDPSTWPGHLEPFGYKQKTVDIETLYSWPSPKGKNCFELC